MKPPTREATISNSFRIYKRGENLRRHSQCEERRFYLSRILLAAVEAKSDKQSITHRTISSQERHPIDANRTLEPLRTVVARHLYDASEEIRRRRELLMKQYNLDDIDLSERKGLVGSSRQNSRTRPTGTPELRSRYSSLVARSRQGIFH